MFFATLRRRRRQFAWVLLGLFVLGFIAATAMRVYVGREYARGLQVIQAAGIPLTVDELKAQYEAQCPSMEAFALYERAFAVMGDSSALYELVCMSGESVYALPTSDLQKLHAFVEENAEAIAILGQATRLPCAQFPLEQMELAISDDLNRDIEKDLFSRASNAMYILRLAAQDCLVRGDNRIAAQHVLSMMGLAQQLMQALSVTGRSFGAAYLQTAQKVAVLGMQHSKWEVAEIDSMAAVLMSCDAVLNPTRRDVGEFAIYRKMSYAPTTSIEVGEWALSVLPGQDQESVAAMASIFPWFVSSIGGVASYVRWQEWWHLDMVHYEEARLRIDPKAPYAVNAPQYRKLLGLTLIPMGSAISWRSHYIDRARVCLFLAACAVEKHQLTHGVLPATLGELDEVQRGWIREDPYTGEPIHYRREGQGFVLYSVDEDLSDDGGDEDEDIVFQVTR